jgi:hypothetical protein
MRTASQN